MHSSEALSPPWIESSTRLYSGQKTLLTSQARLSHGCSTSCEHSRWTLKSSALAASHLCSCSESSMSSRDKRSVVSNITKDWPRYLSIACRLIRRRTFRAWRSSPNCLQKFESSLPFLGISIGTCLREFCNSFLACRKRAANYWVPWPFMCRTQAWLTLKDLWHSPIIRKFFNYLPRIKSPSLRQVSIALWWRWPQCLSKKSCSSMIATLRLFKKASHSIARPYYRFYLWRLASQSSVRNLPRSLKQSNWLPSGPQIMR